MSDTLDEELSSASGTEYKEENDDIDCINIFRELTHLHQSFINLGYNSFSGVDGEIHMEKPRVGKIILRPAKLHKDAELEILTMAHSNDGETVEGTVRTIVGDSDTLELLVEPQDIPYGKAWPIKVTI